MGSGGISVVHSLWLVRSEVNASHGVGVGYLPLSDTEMRARQMKIEMEMKMIPGFYRL